MIKLAGYVLGSSFTLVSAALAGMPESKTAGQVVASAPLSTDASSWPWIAAAGLVVTLGAIALVSRRRMPFGGRH